MYRNFFKRVLDFLGALIALILLSPVFLILIIWIRADSKGPALFRQRRIGRSNAEFNILKFRTMRCDAPADTPTHLLEQPDCYITRAGRFLRKTSLDELPQLINILKGDMSFVGPRPALWNQYDLTALRTQRGVQVLRPGLTGLAQISGRDELPIPVKVEYDMKYAETIGFCTDFRILLKTVLAVLKSDGIVEGKTKKSQEETAPAMKNNPLVSVITPAYNAEAVIAETIESVLNQTYPNWEMIIVDDCSTDRTLAIAQGYAKSDERISVIRHSVNSGVAGARNTALDEAKGDYIAFLDSDDLWLPEKLELQLAFMETNGYALTYTDYQMFLPEGTEKTVSAPRRMRYQDIFKNTSIGCLTVMVNRKMVGDFHMPPLSHGEDQCTWQEILKRGYVAYGLNRNLARYRVQKNSLSGNKLKAAQKKWYVYRKYHKLSVLRSAYYFVCYAFRALRKHW